MAQDEKVKTRSTLSVIGTGKLLQKRQGHNSAAYLAVSGIVANLDDFEVAHWHQECG
jgi:hypothetical protein